VDGQRLHQRSSTCHCKEATELALVDEDVRTTIFFGRLANDVLQFAILDGELRIAIKVEPFGLASDEVSFTMRANGTPLVLVIAGSNKHARIENGVPAFALSVHYRLPRPYAAQESDIRGISPTQDAREIAVLEANVNASSQSDFVAAQEIAVHEADVAPFDVLKKLTADQGALDFQMSIANLFGAERWIFEIGKCFSEVPDAWFDLHAVAGQGE
jgi:hypothetical protein